MAEDQPNSAQSRADLVMGLAQEVAEERAQRNKVSAEHAERAAAVDKWLTRERGVLIALILAVPVLVALIVVGMQGPSLGAMPPKPRPDQTQDVLNALVKDIESFRQDFAELPSSLAEVGIPRHGEWTYTKDSADHYRVVLRLNGQVLTFDSLQKAS
jgi:hypothetical protein